MKKKREQAAPDRIRRVRHRPLRVPYDRDLVLRLEDGQMLVGRAKNFSSGGFLMMTGLPLQGRNFEGVKGFLVVETDVESVELPCQIVRMEKNSIAAMFI